MSYLGIGYSGSDPAFLKDQVKKHMEWLKGDRLPRFYGNSFLVLYDSNTAREFAKKCINASEDKSITIYQMSNPLN
jgi:hypothetical protein